MKTPPPPAEICRRRGIILSPIITKCFDETLDHKEPSPLLQMHLRIFSGGSQDQYHIRTDSCYEEVSRWSTTDSSSNYSEECETEFNDEESSEDRLERWQHFFSDRPLMHCLDTTEDQMLADMLFERLLKEVQQPGLPFEGSGRRSRGELQIRAFWDNVRSQLHIGESSLEDDMPPVLERPPTTADELYAYSSLRRWRNARFVRSDIDSNPKLLWLTNEEL